MTPIFSTCIIAYMYSVCLLENGSLYTAFRVEDRLETYIDGKPYVTIVNGKVI